MTAYRIKPLGWKLVRRDADGEWWTAPTVFGSIDVEEDPSWHARFSWRYCFDEYYDEGRHDCESIEDGKRQAEEFYLSRLLPALEQTGKEADQ